MMTNLTRSAVALFVCLALAAGWSGALAAEIPNITGVQVSPDARQIMIKGDGPLGKHSAFVISHPHRLVVDFEAAGLGAVSAKTKIHEGPINEIRMGKVNSRSRVVADFGDNAVPPFKIHFQGNVVVIALGDGPSSAARGGTISAPSPVVARALNKPRAGARSAKTSLQVDKHSGMTIKTSGIKDSLVFMELADKSNPKRVYRLAISCDLGARQIRHATLSDDSGAVRRFELAGVNLPRASRGETNEPVVGPRKEGESQAGNPGKRTRYHWGLPNVERKEPQDELLSSKSPFDSDDSQIMTRVSAR